MDDDRLVFAHHLLNFLDWFGDRRAVAPLLKLLSEGGLAPFLHGEAVAILGRLRDPRAAAFLIQTARTDKNSVSDFSLGRALGRIGGKQAADFLLASARDGDARLRRIAAHGLVYLGAAEAMPLLLRALESDKDADVRAAAASSLGGRRNPRAVPALLKAMSDPAEDVRQNAAGSLGTIGHPKATDKLIHAIEQDSRAVREAAVIALGRFDHPKRVGPLLKVVGDGYGPERWYALNGLRESKDKRVVAAAVAMLRSPLRWFRRTAIYVLRRVKDRATTPAVLAALSDRAIRDQAISCLEVLQDPRAVEPLIRILQRHEPGWRDAISALGGIGDERAKAVLSTCLADPREAVRVDAAAALADLDDPRCLACLRAGLGSDDSEVQATAAWALSRSRDPRAVPALLAELRKQGEHVTWALCDALGAVKKPEATDALLARGEGAPLTPEEQRSVLYGLGMTGDPRVLPHLLKALDDGDRRIRLAAVGALGMTGDARVVPHLAKALGDGDRRIRSAAVRGLGRLQDRRATDLLLTGARDTSRWVRVASIRFLAARDDARAPAALIAALGDEHADVCREAAKGLRRVTGQDFGWDAARWGAWLGAHPTTRPRTSGATRPASATAPAPATK
jgi:HEAT repeat protein